ncbi:MAG: succinyldiaminopimelate transaminase [Immundisolibacter sp.]|uniref:succinyldiaminopimelate transaminase n=1 Tax=Immundisolibacter sp. TaxID=1934948 RepID=UPI00198995E9|nr:succinyldiaminopimelate transaminase [Immundisolibacter sp.]MBC7161704.1 succinyldiaminopimelate transaminase [Immundisolibacter sp.]
MNPGFADLQPYPFERLRGLLADVRHGGGLPLIDLSIGEPRHAPPALVRNALIDNLDGLGRYPKTAGSDELRAAIADWLVRRHGLPEGAVDPARQVLPASGTREALFAIAQCLIDRAPGARVAMPNPFYQIYEGAALLAGARPLYIPCAAAADYQPDFGAVPAAVWRDVQLLYICSPHNPTGRVLTLDQLKALVELAQRHDFVIASDECYSEIYPDDAAPPAGILAACRALGLDGFERCLVFQSLSKRSSVPGLRSGFVAGDARLIERFLLYRTYHGCALPEHVQAASAAAWRDEAHVAASRAIYRRKLAAAVPMLGGRVTLPQGGFCLWLPVPGGDDPAFTRRLYADHHLRVLPGSYLARADGGMNPGAGHVRLALVADEAACAQAITRLAAALND